MKTVYIGTSGFAATVLQLSARALQPALVVTRPPSARGRGRRLEPSPVAAMARELGLELAEPEKLAQEGERIAELAPDTVVLCAYGELVREPLLSREILNVHPSLLPRWRGAAPVERTLMAGDELTGVSIMRLVAELDAGPVCETEPVAVDPADDYASLSERLARAADAALRRALRGSRVYAEQDDATATYAEKITAADRVLDPAHGAVALERRVRALHPHIGARLESGLGVAAARVGGPSLEPGVTAAQDGALFLGTASGTLELVRVKPAGGREMDAASYLRGHAV
ncbi:MAG TPA: methionyl-tRNA formyltransferase [Solirubrobacteraceae bacterium]